MCPEKINLFEIISVLVITVAQKVEDIGICQQSIEIQGSK